MDDYKEKYKQAVKKIKDLFNEGEQKGFTIITYRKDFEKIFPELTEPEDEKTRRDIIELIKETHVTERYYDLNKMLTWLEKQGEHIDINPSEFDLRLNKLLKQFETLPKEELTSSLSFYLNVVQNNGTYKQGEQKPSTEVKPKFHEGDWIVDNIGVAHQIEKTVLNVTNNTFGYDIVGGGYFNDDSDVHLWTIQDAKAGDVLACESGWTCIFKSLVNDETFSSYCFMDNTKWLCETGSESHTLNKEFMKAYNGEIYPATKEQRDTLFAKMKEAGYTFDFEKKELKKIEQKLAWSEDLGDYINELSKQFPEVSFAKLSRIVVRVKNWFEKQGEKLPAGFYYVNSKGEKFYSEKFKYGNVVLGIEKPCSIGIDNVPFVGSTNTILTDSKKKQSEQKPTDEDIKEALRTEYEKGRADAIAQMQKEWSEEDESYLNTTIAYLKDAKEFKKTAENCINWLKSLRPQNRWKPSDEQMQVLVWCRPLFADPKSKGILESLINDLKKLTEE